MPCFSHFSIEAWMLRTFFAPPLRSAQAYVGIHAPNLSLAIVPPVSWSFLVADLEGQAAARDAIGTVHHPRRPAGIHPGAERLLLAEIDELAFQDPDLFPEVVRDRLGRLHAGLEAQQPRHVAGVGIAAQDLLVNAGPAGAAGGRAGHGLPRQRVGTEELVLGFGQGSGSAGPVYGGYNRFHAPSPRAAPPALP